MPDLGVAGGNRGSSGSDTFPKLATCGLSMVASPCSASRQAYYQCRAMKMKDEGKKGRSYPVRSLSTPALLLISCTDAQVT